MIDAIQIAALYRGASTTDEQIDVDDCVLLTLRVTQHAATRFRGIAGRVNQNTFQDGK